ncbi:transposase [Micromonospora sp. NPDC005203]|uniref:transposase n=1 Tax=Micromonospora sp. NPDC005203 TaxID=3364226 RepID=UPI0036CCD4D8
MIESLNSRLRQATRRRGHFTTEQAAMKVLYLVVTENDEPARTSPPESPPGTSPQRPRRAVQRPDQWQLETSITSRSTHKGPDSPLASFTTTCQCRYSGIGPGLAGGTKK